MGGHVGAIPLWVAGDALEKEEYSVLWLYSSESLNDGENNSTIVFNDSIDF